MRYVNKMVSEIVLNFLLWYIHEQIKQSLKEKLLKVVLSFYSGRAIKKQKNVIFANFPEEYRSGSYHEACKDKV